MVIDLNYLLLFLSYLFLIVVAVMLLIARRKQQELWNRLATMQRQQTDVAEKLSVVAAELQSNKENNKTILGLLGDLGKAAKTAHKADVEAVAAEVKILQNIVGQLAKTRAVGGGITTTVSQTGKSHVAAPAQEPVIRTDYSTEKILEIIESGLRGDRVDLYIQPVVSLPQRKIRHFECLSRIRDEDGAIVLPEQFVHVAEQAGLMAAVDNLLLFRCIQLVRRTTINNFHGSFFCNLSKHTLHDMDFFEDFLEFLSGNQELASRLVFEVNQSDFDERNPAREQLLMLLAQMGCGLALASVTNVKIDADLLDRCKFKYIKIDAPVLLAALKGTPPLDWVIYRRVLGSYNFDLIIEKIENEDMLLELLEYDIDYGQGYLFGEPRLSKS